MKIISFVSFKGGQGRTTTAINLSAFFSKRGYRTLLVDLDFQASASISLGCNIENITLADVLLDKKHTIKEAIQETSTKNLSIVVGDTRLADFDIKIGDTEGNKSILKKHIQSIRNEYDIISIDTSPSLNLLTINSLMISDYIVIPLTANYLSLQALNQVAKIIGTIRNENTKLKILGILFTIADFRLRITTEAIKMVRDHYKDKVFNSVIRTNVKLTESVAWNKTIFQYAPESIGAICYERAGKEIIRKW